VIAGLRADSWQATDFRTMIMRSMMSSVMNPPSASTGWLAEYRQSPAFL
jgi:hypothetical protein